MKNIILWDIGNVMLKPIHGEILNKIFENRNNNILIEEFRKETSKILNDSFYGNISLEDTWEKMFKIVKITDNNIKYDIKNIEVVRNEELLSYIKDVLSKQYRMGIISDLSQIGLSVVKTFYKDFLDFCDNELVFISVFDRMTKKADKEKYFIKIMQKIQNQNILFIDDEVNNIESAKKNGFDTILFDGGYSNWNKANRNLIEELKERNENHYG